MRHDRDCTCHFPRAQADRHHRWWRPLSVWEDIHWVTLPTQSTTCFPLLSLAASLYRLEGRDHNPPPLTHQSYTPQFSSALFTNSAPIGYIFGLPSRSIDMADQHREDAELQAPNRQTHWHCSGDPSLSWPRARRSLRPRLRRPSASAYPKHLPL